MPWVAFWWEEGRCSLGWKHLLTHLKTLITDEHNPLLLLRNKSENGASQVCTQLSLPTSNCHPAACHSLGVQLLLAPEFC